MRETYQAIFEAIAAELDRAYTKHGRDQWGRHEFYAILKEEVDEAWDAIKADLPQEDLEKEVIQIAAMCVRYLETKDRYRNPNQCPADILARVKRLEEALGSIREYWNGDNNEKAMEDACWHAIHTANEALEAKESTP